MMPVCRVLLMAMVLPSFWPAVHGAEDLKGQRVGLDAGLQGPADLLGGQRLSLVAVRRRAQEEVRVVEGRAHGHAQGVAQRRLLPGGLGGGRLRDGLSASGHDDEGEGADEA